MTITISLTGGYFLPITNPLLKAGIIDAAATLVIFILSLIFNNSSVYDPYWSIAPMIMAGYWSGLCFFNVIFSARHIILCTLVLIWGIRLTYNFFKGWKGFLQEDWRYDRFRMTTGAWYWLISFTGIHFVPTIAVFGACVPVYFALKENGAPFGIPDLAAIGVTVTAIVFEGITDSQLRRFYRKDENLKKTMQTGLRRFSRHPNYFGEILFWWGMYLFAIAANPEYWWTIFGPVLMTLLFIFISIPLMEKRMLEKRPDFADYRKRVSVLIPWFPKK
ncbi:MAG: DUF1295 domain-containing protein [Spirochaetales bacterium]|nr:DUF1295 domain-containing protein [Spirochaetales bacterium]